MKRLISAVLLFALCLCLLPASRAAAIADAVPDEPVSNADREGQCGESLYWKITGSKPNYTLTISGSGRMDDYDGYYKTPWYSYYGNIYSVIVEEGTTYLGERCFSYFSRLKNVLLPSTLEEFGKYSFGDCEQLGSISLPKGLVDIKIGNNAFQGCYALTEIEFPNRVTEIGDNAFWYCTGLTSITFPDSVTGDGSDACTAIGSTAFEGCTGLTSVTIGNNVTAIGSFAFSDCTGLTSVTIPDSVTSIGRCAFSACTGLKSVTIPDRAPGVVTVIESKAFEVCTGLTSITIGRGVTSIEGEAFDGCTGLTSIEIPDSINAIEGNVFSGCTGLTSVTIPTSVTLIDHYAFDGCTGLTDVYYDGTKEQRDSVLTINGNDNLKNATWHYNTQPINGTVKFNEGEVEYKGTTPYVVWNYGTHTPGFTVTDEDGKAIDPQYYDYEYKENAQPGTGYVFVTFKNGYSGTVQQFFKIYLPATTETTVKNVADGIKLTWKAVEGAAGYVIYRRAWNLVSAGWTDFVRWNNTKDLEWTDTKVYAGTRYQYGIKAYFARRTDPVAEAEIGGNVGDNFNLGMVGPLKTTVRITTRTLTSVKAGTKQMTVKWEGSRLFTGYEIQYALNSAFTKSVKTVKIKDASTVKKVIGKLKTGKKYYVRVRSYHVFEGMTYYGQWSNRKSCTVK